MHPPCIFFILETCPSGHIRKPTHQVVASYMGRSVHVEDQGAGRFCGEASEAWEEESMGKARWKTRCSSDHLVKGRPEEEAGQRRWKRREESRFNRGRSGGSSLLFKPLMQDSDSDLEPDFNPQLQSGSGQKAEFDAEAPPGSRATTVHPGAWWADSFRFACSWEAHWSVSQEFSQKAFFLVEWAKYRHLFGQCLCHIPGCLSSTFRQKISTKRRHSSRKAPILQ